MSDTINNKTNTTTKPAENTEHKRNPNIVGSMWKRKGSNANGPYEFISGPVDLDGKHYELLIRKNSFRKDERSPDYKVYINDRLKKTEAKTETIPQETSPEPAEEGLF